MRSLTLHQLDAVLGQPAPALFDAHVHRRALADPGEARLDRDLWGRAGAERQYT